MFRFHFQIVKSGGGGARVARVSMPSGACQAPRTRRKGRGRESSPRPRRIGFSDLWLGFSCGRAWPSLPRFKVTCRYEFSPEGTTDEFAGKAVDISWTPSVVAFTRSFAPSLVSIDGGSTTELPNHINSTLSVALVICTSFQKWA